MTNIADGFTFTKPGALIAALPAVLGFVPEKSLVLVSLQQGQMGAVMRADLTDDLDLQVGHLARLAAGAQPTAVIAVFVDATGAGCEQCDEEFLHVAGLLGAALGAYGISLYATHVVDSVAVGGRWHCVDGCGAEGPVDDPSASPLAAAAVLDGRRLYGARSELAASTAVDDERAARVAQIIDVRAGVRQRAVDDDARARIRLDVASARAAAAQVSAGRPLGDQQLADIGCALIDPAVRDTLYALAVGDDAGDAESLLVELARSLPPRWRIEALVLLAFAAYARGDGPLAGVSLEAALRIDATHRMAGMLDQALQSALPPEQIRELAAVGFRLARRYGIALPPQRPYGECAS
ncbi:MAG: DUF4192 domain-containing protein [Mycobacterium sp.]